MLRNDQKQIREETLLFATTISLGIEIKNNILKIPFNNIVVTQFWIHQDFLECCFISIIIHKNPKKLRKKFKIQKYIFLESTTSFHQNRVHRVNTGQTMSIRVKNEFHDVSGQNRHFRPKPSPPDQYGSNHVDQGKK